MATLLAVIATVTTPTLAAAEPPPYWQKVEGCGHGHTRQVAELGLTRLLKNHQPVTTARQRATQHLRRCTMTRSSRRHVNRRWRALRAWRMSYAHRWPIKFNSLPAGWQSWAYSTGSCESGNNPATATGNGFYGAFQFLPSTWWAAGGTGMPNQHSWAYQAWIAVHWRMRSSQSQWPNCAPW